MQKLCRFLFLFFIVVPLTGCWYHTIPPAGKAEMILLPLQHKYAESNTNKKRSAYSPDEDFTTEQILQHDD